MKMQYLSTLKILSYRNRFPVFVLTEHPPECGS